MPAHRRPRNVANKIEYARIVGCRWSDAFRERESILVREEKASCWCNHDHAASERYTPYFLVFRALSAAQGQARSSSYAHDYVDQRRASLDRTVLLAEQSWSPRHGGTIEVI